MCIVVGMGSFNGHRKSLRHFHESGDFHELTFSCYQRWQLIMNDEWRLLLSKCIDDAIVEAQFELVSFVYMPEHLHLLVYPTGKDVDIGKFLARVKQPFSKQIKDILIATRSTLLSRLTIRERPGKDCFRFWQEGAGYDRNVRSPEALEASINYIHNNPVRRGLCARATDWPWSSARYYLQLPTKQQFAGLPHIHGIPPGALGHVVAE